MASAPSAPRLPSGLTHPVQERSLVPGGMATILPQAARHVRRLEEQLLTYVNGWAYDEIILPTFEYLDVLAPGLEPELIEKCYKFPDRTTGRILLLRPDATAQIARTVGMGMMGSHLPLRLSYRATVFRHEPEHAGRDREIFQVGAELIGANDAAADCEIISLLIESLREAGLRSFKISLGHVGFFKRLLVLAGLSPDGKKQAEQAAARKDLPRLEEILLQAKVRKSLAHVILEAPELCGHAEVLARGRTLARADRSLLPPLDRLTAVYRLLCAAGYKEHLFLDLGEFRGFDYYDGTVFDVFAEGIGVELGGGGRYDHLIGRFGRDLPSTGFALNVDRLFQTLALSLESSENDRLHVLVVTSHSSAAKGFGVAKVLRGSKKRVTQQIIAASGKSLMKAAEAEGLRENAHAVILVDGGEDNDHVMVGQRLNGRFRFHKSTAPVDQLLSDNQSQAAKGKQ
jgi:ATP phosphoribosyltransferase regulatory subunit